jgi:hypothetical protein
VCACEPARKQQQMVPVLTQLRNKIHYAGMDPHNITAHTIPHGTVSACAFEAAAGRGPAVVVALPAFSFFLHKDTSEALTEKKRCAWPNCRAAVSVAEMRYIIVRRRVS